MKKAVTEKKVNAITNVTVIKIHAEQHCLCAPPALWEIEAEIDVSFADQASEKWYISTIDLGEAEWVVATKSMNDLQENEKADPYIIASYATVRSASKTPFGEAIKALNSIFSKIAVL